MPLSLSEVIRKEYKKALKEVNNDIKKVARVMHESLVILTPVDTSAALSNWKVGIGQAPSRVSKAQFEGSKGSTYDQSVDKTIRIGSAKINTKKIEDTVYIANRIDYIGDLDDGKSPQNKNFVKEAIALGLEQI